ncbi:MAG: TonB-dependent receptor plug domain-containing protein, partial [Candidatus Marinimicrobia bacterium]|nr:TonB-dependent receptor plug domain-containing protein [Candidatus Neomarinimicrobiota bacterium]
MLNQLHRMGALVLIFSLFALQSTVHSSVRVSAHVTDSRTGAGIVMVNVLVLGTSQGTVTDTEGRFNLVLEPGQSLQLRHIAYQEMTHVVRVDDLGEGAFLELSLEPRYLLGEQVFVSATRGREDLTPAAFSTLTQQDLSTVTVEDVPMALSGLPGVYAFSDAGNGVGYTYLKIRGFDQDRIAVMINGIPMNDPESHQVYWVDHGDILAGTGSVQVQRGVGNSLYGTAAFGGSVNLVTSPRAMPEGLTLTTGYGDFTDTGFSAPSRKLALKWSGQPLAGRPFTLYGRYSRIRSDGYRLGSGTDQDAFHIIGEYLQPEASTRLELISGSEVTHFSWDGVIPLYGYDLDDRTARRYNFYADSSFNGGLTNANKDVFIQNIASLQHARQLGAGVFSLSLYGVTGWGYFEQFKGGRDLWEYNLIDVLPETVEKADIIRRRWLVNGYWGVIPQYTLRGAWGLTVLGGDARFYNADHYGRVLSVDG